MICASCGGEVESEATGCSKCKGPVLLDQRYRLHSILGRGANGITYRAERVSDQALFAVKEMPLRTMESTKAMELFDREARVLRQLDYEAIPKYEDDFVFGEGKSSALYLVQELVEGQSLDEEMKDKRYTEQEVFAIVAELAETLDYLHRRSPAVIHRDVKPKNVMRRSKDHKLVLIDFGSVRDALSMTGGSTVAGTFGYMAPEQLAGKASPASDVYSLGALAAALLSRKEPDTMLGDDHTVDVRAHVDISERGLDLLEKMLARDPKDRPKRGRDVVDRAKTLARASTPPAPAEKQKQPKPNRQWEQQQQKKKERNQSAEATLAQTRLERKLAERERKDKARKEREEAAAKDGYALPPDPKPARPHSGYRPPKKTSAERQQLKIILAAIIAPTLLAVGIWAFFAHRENKKTSDEAKTTIGVPQIYARPISVDINGDGIDDLIVVNSFDSGVRTDEDGRPNEYDRDHGRWVDYIQAIDGKDARILYSIKLGDGFTSTGPQDKSLRAALVASKTRLGVAHVSFSKTAKTEIDIYELATGKSIKSISLEALNGAVCMDSQGKFQFQRAVGGVTTVDLEAATFTANGPRTCTRATPNVAEVPMPTIGPALDRITSHTVWDARFSSSLPLRTGGPYQGADVVSSGGIAVLVHDGNKKDSAATEPMPTGPTISMDYAVDQSAGGPDNGKIEIVGLDLGTNELRFKSSLASLGFTTQAIDHLEGTPDGTIVFFKGSAGLAFIDTTGRKKWAMGLPKGTRLSSYTLSRQRIYMHVFGSDNSIYSNLSKKLESRVVVLDLDTGAWWRSFPDGPLTPDPTAAGGANRPTIDLAAYNIVKGCSCLMMADGSALPEKIDWAEMSVDERKKAMLAKDLREAAKKTDGGKDAMKAAEQVLTQKFNGTLPDGGAPQKLDLGMWVKSTTESGGRKRFSVYYSLAIDGQQKFALPHYNERRERIAPPRTLEGEVALSIACGNGVLVVAHDRVATAWSVAKQDELWTVDLPSAVSEPKTSLGGGATITCALGKVDPKTGRVSLPIPAGKELALTLADGSPFSTGKDAGAK